MKKIVFGLLSFIFLGACSGEYVTEYNNETFTFGNSLTYQMPILESDMLQPSLDNELSIGDTTQMYNNYWFLDEDNLLADVSVTYRLTSLDEEYMPYYFVPDEELTAFTVGEIVNQELVEINGRHWSHIEEEPMHFESDGEEQVSVSHTYYYHASFEVYSYVFSLTATKEEFEDENKLANSFDKMEQILSMAEFTHEPTMTEEGILQTLNDAWATEGAGYLQFNQNELRWYKDADMQNDNVLVIDITDIIPLIHPENDTEFALLRLDYLTETIDGQTYDSEETLTLFVNFSDENNIILVDTAMRSHYFLSRIE